MSYFPEPFSQNKNKIKIELDLSNYATKSHLKGATGIDTSKFTKKINSVKLKLDVDDFDVDKLKTVPVDLSKLSDVVKNQVVKKSVYDKLVKKVNAIQAIDTSDLVKKADNNTRSQDNEKKIINHDKYITKNEFNKLAEENFIERLKQINLASKNDIADFVKKNKTKQIFMKN